MTSGIRALVPVVLLLAACGGGGGDGTGGVTLNAWTGTLNIAAGTATGTCATTHEVVFSATGSTPLTVNAAVGDCLRAVVTDGTTHIPAARETTGCGMLNLGQIDGTTTSATSAVFTTPRVCHWQDLSNPPPAPPDGGTGGY